MKYIKTYENNVNYKQGDYIILIDFQWARKPQKCCYIMDKVFEYYDVTAIDTNNEIFDFYVKDADILRLATPNESNEFKQKIKLILASNKYNL
jgi:hypothetical protein